jgi:lysophospholipase L1-like esterase
VKRLRIFAKGNVDVHDSLHSCRLGGDLLWNGINAVFRERSLEVMARVRHETWARSDALLAADGAIPDLVASRDLPLGAYPATSQFSRAVLEDPADVVVLSIMPDIMSGMMRHRDSGVLLYPSGLDQWSPQDRLWLKSDFDALGPLDVAQSMDNLRAIVADIQAQRAAAILIYNLSAVVPGETLYCHEGMDETLSDRIRRFNLGLVELSRQTGINIIDADRILAEHGALALKRDPVHLTAEGYRLLAYEVVRVLEDIGVLEEDAVPA